MVRCKSCEREHASEIRMDEESFRGAELQDNTEQCPYCKDMSTHDKIDYFFKWGIRYLVCKVEQIATNTKRTFLTSSCSELPEIIPDYEHTRIGKQE